MQPKNNCVEVRSRGKFFVDLESKQMFGGNEAIEWLAMAVRCDMIVCLGGRMVIP